MSLRPRYSLLTLLVVTALIAGGVKLWYGPHHVVERTSFGGQEMEYSFTRNWHGNRIIDGPTVHRRYQEKKLVFVCIGYFRQGLDSGWACWCGDDQYMYMFDLSGDFLNVICSLSDRELRDFQQARDTELQRLVTAGSYKFQREGTTPESFYKRFLP